MVATQLSPAAYGTEPHLRHLDLDLTPVLSVTSDEAPMLQGAGSLPSLTG